MKFTPRVVGSDRARSAAAACGDKGTNAEKDEDEADGAHDGLDDGSIVDGAENDLTGRASNCGDDAGEGSEESEETDGDGNVHEEHSLFSVGSVGE